VAGVAAVLTLAYGYAALGVLPACGPWSWWWRGYGRGAGPGPGDHRGRDAESIGVPAPDHGYCVAVGRREAGIAASTSVNGRSRYVYA
jgi:hypothetical protein